MTASRVLVAGIGNVFLGDDGFGVEVVRRLAERPPRPNVCVADFGIRGFDLTYALLEHERAIFVDATRRGGAAGTLYVLEPEITTLSAPSTGFEHGVTLAGALWWARQMGGRLASARLVGCEPASIPDPTDVAPGLSPAVAGAVEEAISLVEELLGDCNA